ncbi:MAG: hypothetical protein P1P84_00930 [Deferrisomatales bacterium]|nr:hypothetical protein [Deferrisomatales bacterium]
MHRKTIFALVAAGVLAATAALAGEYLAGDFHQHSLYTDGSNKFNMMMARNNVYLDWWANSEHGGESNRDGNGRYWDEYAEILGDVEMSGGHQEMWRWQSLRDYVFPDILEARNLYTDKIIINGLEWNVPGHEHTSTAIHQLGEDGNAVATAISEFEYRFDKSDDDTSRDGEIGLLGDALSKTNDTKDDAIAGVAFMQALVDAGIADAWVVPAHIERAHSFFIEDFRNWMDYGPDVAIGFEGAPGHQTSGDRGFGRSSLGGGTYGGTGWYVSQVGGLWDALAAEGRKFFNFASSDDHGNWSQGGSDFWPGEYQKNYTFVDTSAADPIKAVFEGVKSGNSWNVQGDLIDELRFTVSTRDASATMGETLEVEEGDKVTIRITVRDPKGRNNCPLDMDNPSLAQIGISQPLSKPELDHVDLIAGSITGNVPLTDFSDMANQSYVDTDYGTDAAVVATFDHYSGEPRMTYVYKFRAEKDMFFRVRGTNLPAGVPYETDDMGNPLADSEANDNLYASMDPAELQAHLFDDVVFTTNSKLDEVAEAYADLWFYSNPVYLKVKPKSCDDGKGGKHRRHDDD